MGEVSQANNFMTVLHPCQQNWLYCAAEQAATGCGQGQVSQPRLLTPEPVLLPASDGDGQDGERASFPVKF